MNEVSFVSVSFLPPATKLGQGYIFTGVCDSVPRRGGGLVRGGAWTGGVPGRGGLLRGVTWWRLPPGTATAAGGTHPTGMHSCSFSVLFKIDFEKCLGKPKKI